jgi:hypothetical protein
MNITLVNQPPNSPNTNVLDLGYFNAIQSLQHRKHTNTVPELVKAVEDSFKSKNLTNRHSTKYSLHTNSGLNRSFFVMVASNTTLSHGKREAVKTGSTASIYWSI